jgi:hypothetical protein
VGNVQQKGKLNIDNTMNEEMDECNNTNNNNNTDSTPGEITIFIQTEIHSTVKQCSSTAKHIRKSNKYKEIWAKTQCQVHHWE